MTNTISLLSKDQHHITAVQMTGSQQETDTSAAVQMAQDDQHNTVVSRAIDLQQQIAMLEDQKQQLQSEKDKLERALVQQLAAA